MSTPSNNLNTTEREAIRTPASETNNGSIITSPNNAINGNSATNTSTNTWDMVV